MVIRNDKDIRKFTDWEIKTLFTEYSKVARKIAEDIDSYPQQFMDFKIFENEFDEKKKKYKTKSVYSKSGYIKHRFTSKLLGSRLLISDWRKTSSPTEVLGLYLVRHRLPHFWAYPNKRVHSWELDITIGDMYGNIPLVMDIHGKEAHSTEWDQFKDAVKRDDLTQKGMRYLEFQGSELVNNISEVEKRVKTALAEEYEKVNAVFLFKNHTRPKKDYSPKQHKKA